jgi:hypothetical protein
MPALAPGAMPEPVPNPDLMPALGRLVRGLSALFWGLPVAFLVCYYTAKADALRDFGVLPPVASTGLLVYGLGLLTSFQGQERVWRSALDRARLLALVNFGLSPFIYWWHRFPEKPFFLVMVMVLQFSALAFLGCLNLVLQRLAAMLPDEALRLETRQYTALNINLLLVTCLFSGAYVVLASIHDLPRYLQRVAVMLENGSLWFLILLVLLPLAMTMALLWKTKEVILDSVFGAKRS